MCGVAAALKLSYSFVRSVRWPALCCCDSLAAFALKVCSSLACARCSLRSQCAHATRRPFHSQRRQALHGLCKCASLLSVAAVITIAIAMHCTALLATPARSVSAPVDCATTNERAARSAQRNGWVSCDSHKRVADSGPSECSELHGERRETHQQSVRLRRGLLCSLGGPGSGAHIAQCARNAMQSDARSAFRAHLQSQVCCRLASLGTTRSSNCTRSLPLLL